MAIKRILCVCKGNTCRSPMLAAVLQRTFRTNAVVESAGIIKEAEGQSAASEWTTLKDITGVDLTNHRSRHIDSIGDLAQFDYVICAEPAVVDAVKLLGVKESKILLANAPAGIPNPWQGGLEAYQNCYPVILRAATDFASRLS